jgi:hypothetical protein
MPLKAVHAVAEEGGRFDTVARHDLPVVGSSATTAFGPVSTTPMKFLYG